MPKGSRKASSQDRSGKRVAPQSPPSAPKKARPGEKPADDPDGFASWRFEHVDHDFPQQGGWPRVDGPALKDILEALRRIESLTRRELFRQRHNTKGAIVRYGADALEGGISRDARERLHDIRLGDLDHLIRIRVGATKRVFAWEGNASVFNLLWWDPEHEVYPTEPSNT